MVPLRMTAAHHATLAAAMAITNPAMHVYRMIVRMAKRPVQTTERQVKSRPAVAVYGAVNQLARATIHATAQAQIAVAA
jgi:hypothetical protein